MRLADVLHVIAGAAVFVAVSYLALVAVLVL